jgi:hypothetical protein
VRGRSENLDIAVTFHPARLPARVHWAVWHDQQDSSQHDPGPADAEPADAEPAPLDRRHRARRFVPFVEDAAVGFRWYWAPPDR